jgi:hypothetical protein
LAQSAQSLRANHINFIVNIFMGYTFQPEKSLLHHTATWPGLNRLGPLEQQTSKEEISE